MPSAMALASKRSPTQGGIGDGHANKAARVEASAPQGFVPPPSIAEGTEPPS
jgi:hypothetical protein